MILLVFFVMFLFRFFWVLLYWLICLVFLSVVEKFFLINRFIVFFLFCICLDVLMCGFILNMILFMVIFFFDNLYILIIVFRFILGLEFNCFKLWCVSIWFFFMIGMMFDVILIVIKFNKGVSWWNLMLLFKVKVCMNLKFILYFERWL